MSTNTTYDLNAILRRPPHGEASGDATANHGFSTAGAASTAEQDITGADTGQTYILLRANQAGALAGSVIGFIRFGQTGMGAAIATDWPLYQGELQEWLCLNPMDRFCRVIRLGATDVDVDFYLSDKPG